MVRARRDVGQLLEVELPEGLGQGQWTEQGEQNEECEEAHARPAARRAPDDPKRFPEGAHESRTRGSSTAWATSLSQVPSTTTRATSTAAPTSRG